MRTDAAPAAGESPPPPHRAGPPVGYGGFWIRVGAAIIAFVIVALFAWPFRAVWRAVAPDPFIWGPVRASGVAVLVLWWAYYVITTATSGGTIGKLAVGLRVTGEDFSRPDWATVFFRELVGRVIVAATFGIGYVWAAFDPRKQGWHDKIADTVVLKRVNLAPGAADPWAEDREAATGRHRSSG
jgi:uncharacterized RDD family membrane protein YckC